MSTLKVAAINNPSAVSGGISISTAGNPTGTGLDLITSQSFTTAGAVNVNNCFTSAYDNYRILLSVATHSAIGDVRMRMRLSGTDATGATDYGAIAITQSVAAASPTKAGAASTSGFRIFYAGTGSKSRESIDIFSPALSVATQISAFYADGESASAGQVELVSGVHIQAVAYDGFTVYPVSGTITGTIKVFGYRN